MRCGNYRCKLLKRVEAGETTLTDALATVTTTKALARSTYPNGRPAGTPPGMADGALWQAEAGELEARLDRDFEEE